MRLHLTIIKSIFFGSLRGGEGLYRSKFYLAHPDPLNRSDPLLRVLTPEDNRQQVFFLPTRSLDDVNRLAVKVVGVYLFLWANNRLTGAPTASKGGEGGGTVPAVSPSHDKWLSKKWEKAEIRLREEKKKLNERLSVMKERIIFFSSFVFSPSFF